MQVIVTTIKAALQMQAVRGKAITYQTDNDSPQVAQPDLAILA